MQHPLAVGPPEPSPSIVVVIGLVGEFVMVAVQAHPLDRTALAGQGPHQHKQPLDPARCLETAVGHQTMQAKGDPKHRDPVQGGERHQCLPAPVPGQEGKYRAHVHRQHEAGGAQFHFSLARGQRWSAPIQPLLQCLLRQAGCGGGRGCSDQTSLRGMQPVDRPWGSCRCRMCDT